MHVLVTGGAGFIGSHVVDALIARGDEVTVVDALIPAAWHHAIEPPKYLNTRARFVRGDVRDAELLDALLAGVDAVCHQAAMVGLGVDIGDITEYASINVLGTAVLLKAMAKASTPALVLASSMVVYGEGRYECAEHGTTRPGSRFTQRLDAGEFEPPCPTCGLPLTWQAIDEGAPFDPQNVYADTKAGQENLAVSWAKNTGGTAARLRYHNVYGPRMPRDTPYAGVASIFRSSLERGEAPQVFEDGGQMRDFVDVRDVAAANVAALDTPQSAAFNVSSGTPHTVGDMATALATEFGGPLPVVTGQYRIGDVRHIVASPVLARTTLGFHASQGFDDGMREFAHAELRT